MAYRLFVNSADGVTLRPEYDYKEADTKIEDNHRTRDGSRYAYRWAKYDKITFTVNYLDTATKLTVNSWWDTNTELFFKDESDPTVYSVCLTNDEKPIGELNVPYNNLWRGLIELESF